MVRRSRANSLTVRVDVVGLDHVQLRAEQRAEAAQRPQAAVLLVAQVARRLDPEDVERRAEPLGRAPGAAHDALVLRSRAHEREQPLGDRRRGLLARHAAPAAPELDARDPLRADRLGDLAQRHLAQGDEVLDREEAVQRGLDPLLRIDAPGPQALEQFLGREVDDDDVVGAREDRVRAPSRGRARRSARSRGR